MLLSLKMVRTTLAAWLAYIETLHKKESDYTLDRIQTVADKLKLPQFSCPVITIGGTNGKGSCVALLEAILTKAGYCTGAYTSPYLMQYNERIRLNGHNASDKAIVSAFHTIEQARKDTPLTYFEFSVLTALYLFQQAKLDVILLEVGLGGRLDAVNIVNPDLAVITTIALDHMALLGNDRESIAKEKAGIIRAGKPVVCGDPQPPQTLIQAAQKLAAPLYCQQKDFSYSKTQSNWTFCHANTKIKHLPIPQFALQNAATVLMALQCLATILPVKFSAIRAGLESATLPGRVQLIPGNIRYVLDVAHNPQSSQYLAAKLKQLKIKCKIVAVFSMLADKDIAGAIAPLTDCIDNWLTAPLMTKRAAPQELLIKALETNQVKQYQCYPTLEQAYQQAQNIVKQGDIITVFGSFYTVHAIMKFLKS